MLSVVMLASSMLNIAFLIVMLSAIFFREKTKFIIKKSKDES